MSRLHQHFNSQTKGRVSTSLESFGIELLALGITALVTIGFLQVVGRGVRAAFDWTASKKKSLQAQDPKNHRTVAQTRELITKTYLNPEWLSKQTPATGSFKDETISDVLVKGNSMPDNPGQAAQAHLRATLNMLIRFRTTYQPWANKTKRVAEAAVRMPDPYAAAEYVDKMLGNVQLPDMAKVYKDTDLLGNPKLKTYDGNHLTFTYIPAMTLQPLTMEQIPAVAQALVDYLDASDRLKQLWKDLNVHYNEESDFWENHDPHWQALVDMDAFDNYSLHEQYNNWGYMSWALVEHAGLISKALESWLEHSLVKHRSNKANVGQEG